MTFDTRDCRIDTFSSGIPGVNANCQVRVTHVPSGKIVFGSGASQLRLRDQLMAELKAKVEAA